MSSVSMNMLDSAKLTETYFTSFSFDMLLSIFAAQFAQSRLLTLNFCINENYMPLCFLAYMFLAFIFFALYLLAF
jgi:hypothetical protein